MACLSEFLSASDVKVLQSKGGKPGGKEKQLPAQEVLSSYVHQTPFV